MSKHAVLSLLFVGMIALAVCAFHQGEVNAGPVQAVAAADNIGYLSPRDLVASRDGNLLYVAEHTGRRVAVVDLACGKAISEIPLPDEPGGVAISPDGGRLYVTGQSPQGLVHVIDLKSSKVTGSIKVGHTPSAVAVSPDGKTLYVCNRFNNDVSVVDVASGRETRRLPAVREPVAIAITPDGRHVVVGNQLPYGPTNGPYAAAAITVIDTAADKASNIGLYDGATGVRGVCVSPDGRFAYATHVLGRYHLPTTMVERGWMCSNALAVIDLRAGKLVNTVLLDSVDFGAANPWSVACTSDGKLLCVTHAGSHEVNVIDRLAMHARLDKAAAGISVNAVSASADNVPNDLGFLEGIRRRIRFPGKGPRGLAIIGRTLYAAQYFSDSLAVVDIDPSNRYPKCETILLCPEKPMTPRRLGELCFHDGTLCLQQWQSCSSCHPGARTDGLNWDLLNDGIGNPKNAKSMLLAHRTPPSMISGIRAKAEVAVRAGVRFIQFAHRPEAEAKAIDVYLQSLTPVPSPHLVAGKLSPAARRGEVVFRSAGCASCHSGQLATDLKSYDIGNGPDQLGIKDFDTPTLVETWRTAPYLYDGRAATVTDVLTRFNKSDRHGATSNLTARQISDLVEYVLSR